MPSIPQSDRIYRQITITTTTTTTLQIVIICFRWGYLYWRSQTTSSCPQTHDHKTNGDDDNNSPIIVIITTLMVILPLWRGGVIVSHVHNMLFTSVTLQSPRGDRSRLAFPSPWPWMDSIIRQIWRESFITKLKSWHTGPDQNESRRCDSFDDFGSDEFVGNS